MPPTMEPRHHLAAELRPSNGSHTHRHAFVWESNLSPSTCSPTPAPHPPPTAPPQPKRTSQGCWKLGEASATVCCASQVTPCLRASETLGSGHTQQAHRRGGQPLGLLISGRATEVCAVGLTRMGPSHCFPALDSMQALRPTMYGHAHQVFATCGFPAVRPISSAFVAPDRISVPLGAADGLRGVTHIKAFLLTRLLLDLCDQGCLACCDCEPGPFCTSQGAVHVCGRHDVTFCCNRVRVLKPTFVSDR